MHGKCSTEVFDDVPRYKKKSQKTGRKRADHKHVYENCVFGWPKLHYEAERGLLYGPDIEYSVGTYCPVCGKIGDSKDISWTDVSRRDRRGFCGYSREWSDAALREFDEATRTLPFFFLSEGLFQVSSIQKDIPNYGRKQTDIS